MAEHSDIANCFHTTFPDTTWSNSLRMQANSLVEVLDKAAKELAHAPKTLATLERLTDPEAEIKANLIRQALGDLATALQETNAIQEVDRDAIEAVPAPDINKALLVAETGLIFNPSHPIAHL